ncbi:helix-turn-helix domain-containing protein [Natrinema hispanicum]|uniref:Helix-turn-helix domain-containing protein n=1 Tax=Natrinema hispanicum TaxID=392421 RepID=A0A1G6QQW2_9EURY|nr:helix-turn-helix domain-containing protein [Natrinema hispanicum]SDC94663.1 Helix-turn-helix domain-containing protein [Natrinema hispanicum]
MALEASAPDETSELERILAALDDDGCREIIAVLETPKTATEIAATADLPLSTTYRKLDQLTKAGLVSEPLGVRQGRHQTSRYVIDFNRITIGLNDDDETFRIDVERSSGRSLGIWSNAGRDG